jgi:glycosyltransferase involved in cell wall biosynthesis
MSTEKPQVSIGLPVFNGESYLKEAVDSLLGQTFRDFELIIADNASTDDTEAISRRLAETDGRIRYVRNETNIGAMGNFNRTVALARGTYFKWAAHDDVHNETCLQRCVQALDRDSGVVLVHPRVQDIDERGAIVRTKRYKLKTDSPDAVERFRDLIRNDYSCEAIFGLMRLDALRATRLLSDYADCDRVLLAEIGLSGRFFEIPEFLFSHREHEDRSVRQYRDRQERCAWFDPRKAGKPGFPYTREFWGFLGAVRRAPIGPGKRLACLGLMARWAVTNRRGLFEDLLFAARYALRPVKRLIARGRLHSSS